MALASIKYDDGSGAFVSNCFPVRTIIKYSEAGEGAWLEAHRAEQRRQFKAVICSKPPRTYSRLRHERIAAEHQEASPAPKPSVEKQVLDGFFLMKHCCVEDPSDLCSVNIAGYALSQAAPDDFQLFDNVAYINAADNILPVEIFSKFSLLRELELPLNSVSDLKITHKMFRNLEMLDLSYNCVQPSDILQLGHLRNLKVLYLSGNNLKILPENTAGFYVTKKGFKQRRFPKLEILCLDDNKLNNYSAFAPLAGLRELKHLNLEKNEITAIPQLEPKSIQHDQYHTASETKSESKEQNQQGTTDRPDSGNDESNSAAEDASAFLFAELKVPDLGQFDLEQTGKVPAEEQEVETDSEDEPDDETKPAIPFPQLRFISLAGNYLTEEEDLLPIAAWPRLSQVHVYENPLTTLRSGDPPLLKQFLVDKLGIDITRIKPPPAPKQQRVEIPPPRPNRKVKTLVPPVPKCDVEKLLMIEASRRPSLVDATEKSPLPPINTPIPSEEKDLLEEQELRAKHEENEAFFMTQVDEQVPGQRAAQHTPKHDSFPRKPASPTSTYAKHKKVVPIERESLFKGYEELLYEDEAESSISIPKDIQTSVQALQFALKHPPTFNTTVNVEKIQKPFTPYCRSDLPTRTRPETKAEKIGRAIETAKRFDTVIESPLEKALTDRDLQKQYPEAAKLLRDIQRKYASVRVDSMKEARATRSAVREAMSGKAHTDIHYMVDKKTSVSGLQRAHTKL